MTETILINGHGFEKRCIVYLGQEELDYELMNSESLEAEIPEKIGSDEIRIKCPGAEANTQITVKPLLEELP